MKKEKLLSALAFLLITGLASAQKKDTLVNTTKNMFSTDVSISTLPLLFNNLQPGNFDINLADISLGLPSLKGDYDPYLFLYRRFLNPKNALRAGLGFQAFVYADSKNQKTDLQLQGLNFNIGIGYERDVILGKRCLLFYGADLTYALKTNAYEFGPINTTYKANKYGISPFAGFGYSITKNFSISAQTNLMLLYYTTRSGNSAFGTSSSKGFGYSIDPPLSLQLRFNIK